MVLAIPCGCAFNACWCILWLAIGIPISIIVLIDAERRGQPGCLWAIIVLALPIVGLVLYLFVVALARPKR